MNKQFLKDGLGLGVCSSISDWLEKKFKNWEVFLVVNSGYLSSEGQFVFRSSYCSSIFFQSSTRLISYGIISMYGTTYRTRNGPRPNVKRFS